MTAGGGVLHIERLFSVLSGTGTVGAEARPVRTGQLAMFGLGDTITVSGAVHQESRHPALDVVVLGSAPIRERIAWSGPFVMNTEEILQSFEDYQAGPLGTIPAQHLLS